MTDLTKHYKFVQENLLEKGIKYCAKETGLTASQIYYIKDKLSMKYIKRGREDSECRVTAKIFCDLTKPLNVYLFGLLWADGSFSYVGDENSKRKFKINKVSLASTSPDAEVFLSLFKKTGNWGFFKKERSEKNPTWKPCCSIYTTNPHISKFLFEAGYHDRTSGANKILSMIPEELHHYWFRGLVDGDGCFHCKKETWTYLFSIASNIDQNWDFCENLFKKLEIGYKIERTMSKTGNYSKIYTNGKFRISALGEFLYKNFETDGLGLLRKWQKYKEIESCCDELSRSKLKNGLL